MIGMGAHLPFFFLYNPSPTPTSAVVFQEDWDKKRARIKAASPYGDLPNWRLLSVIVKNGADLRQEQLALQLILEMQRVWQDSGVDVWVK